MVALLYGLGGFVAFLGFVAAVSFWPEGRTVSSMQYAFPLGALLNMVILGAALGGLGKVIEVLEQIRDGARSRPAGAGKVPDAAASATGAADAGAVATQDGLEVDSRGLSPDGRIQVLEKCRIHQLDDGRWRVEHLDGTPHEAFSDTFVNLGTAKREAAKRL